MPTARSSYRVRKEHHVLRWILLVLVGGVVAYAVALGVSAYTMYSGANDARNQYSELSKQIGAHDYSSAAQTALKLNSTVDSIQAESKGWQWQLAAQIPYLQDDVAVVQGIVDSLDQASNNALVPLANAYQTLESDGVIVSGSVSLQNALKNTSDVAAFATAVASAQQALSTCEERLQATGTSHLDAINQLKDSLQSALSQTDSGIAELAKSGASDGLSKLLAMAS